MSIKVAASSIAVLVALAPSPTSHAPQQLPPQPLTAAEIAGAWSGTLSVDDESTELALEFEPAPDGKVQIKATVPIVHMARVPIGTTTLTSTATEVRLPPFTFTYDPRAGTLNGEAPAGTLVPARASSLALRRVGAVELPARPEEPVPTAAPVWTFEGGSPIWAGATYADGAVYVGGDDGVVHALDARTGARRWSFRALGAVRARPTVVDEAVYFQADDGSLYRIRRVDGTELWRVRLAEQPTSRLAITDPKTRYEQVASEVAVVGPRLFVGTHDGRIVALDAERGRTIWEVRTGDSVIAAPAFSAGRVFAGSFDNHLYALTADDGRLLWKRDTGGAIVSTPAMLGDRLVVGNRAYDLLGLDARTGDVGWRRHVWFSWVESSAVIRDGVAYLGSSDAAAAYAFDAATGRMLWKTDVRGWAWGQPAVTADRVYVGTCSHLELRGDTARGSAVALDRTGGRPVWAYRVVPSKGAPYGFAGAAAVGDGLAFFAGLDGRVYAFKQ